MEQRAGLLFNIIQRWSPLGQRSRGPAAHYKRLRFPLAGVLSCEQPIVYADVAQPSNCCYWTGRHFPFYLSYYRWANNNIEKDQINKKKVIYAHGRP